MSVARDETSYHDMPGVVRAAPLRQPRAAVLPVDRAAHGVLGAGIAHGQHLACIEQIGVDADIGQIRSEEHTSELQSLMRSSYAVFCLKTKKQTQLKT